MEKIALLVREGSLVKQIKVALEKNGALNKNLKISRDAEGNFSVPTNFGSKDDLRLVALDNYDIRWYIDTTKESESGPSNVMVSAVPKLIQKYASELDAEVYAQLVDSIPNKWNIYKPMVLVQAGTFETEPWQKFAESLDTGQAALFWDEICALFPGVTHIAVNKPIIETENEKRIPYNLVPISGNFGPTITFQRLTSPSEDDFMQEFWCHSLQNGVLQTWAPRFTMFSRGNIVEKQRVLTFTDVTDKIVVDLYSGIGYFTLYYLQLRPRHVFCWELNPWSNRGLVQSLTKAGISYKLVLPEEELTDIDPSTTVYIFQEDNKNCVRRFHDFNFKHDKRDTLEITHINLGLLPTSSMIWPEMLQLAALNTLTSTMLHIHENCHVTKLGTIMDTIQNDLQDLSGVSRPSYMPLQTIMQIKLNKIKTYAPDVWHIVADFSIRNS